MSRFFIDRPIFSWVFVITIMLLGGIATLSLPISQYPQIAPTQVVLTATYAGADAATVESSVTKVIEQGMTGIDNLDYMSATSTSTGTATITLTFVSGTNPDTAQVQVQNKLQIVQAQLPSVVQATGVSVNKATAGFLMVLGFVSTDGKLSSVDLGDYASSTLKDPIGRLPGVGSTQLLGSGYAMRIWLDPEKLRKYALMPGDVASAIQEQNVQVPAGQLGDRPQVKGQELNFTVTAQSRLQTVRQFENIILKSSTGGAIVRINDIGTVELGSQSYSVSSMYNGMPSASLAISQASGANALNTVRAVKDFISGMEATLPAGVKVVYPYDTSPFVILSIKDVVKTLFEAIALVFIVMFLFLQNVRSTLVPTLVVPVVLLGTFGVLYLFGYSINTLTMFAMVLAIGLLVDDAIVVVENVERVMEEEHLGPREATIKSMGEVSTALIGVVAVLVSVFVPMAFYSGSVGIIYRQFSVTIAAALILSVIVALTFTPALCATLLKPPEVRGVDKKGFFGWFNRAFERWTQSYTNGVGGILKRMIRGLLVFALIGGSMVWLLNRLPTSFLPDEDQGILFAIVQLPVGATVDRAEKTLAQVQDHFLNNEKDHVEGVLTVSGYSFAGEGQNVGLAFIKLKDFDLRKDPQAKAQAVVRRAMGAFRHFKDGIAFALIPPAIPGFGNAGGFDFYLKDLGNHGHEALMKARNQLLAAARQSKSLSGVRPNGQEDTPQYTIEIDQERARALNLNLADVNTTLSTAWGSQYVNDFVDRGRVKKVYVQAVADARMQPVDFGRWFVRNQDGDMVPFSAFATGHWTYGSPRLERYNGSSAVEIQGNAAPGMSSGQAMLEIESIARKLPQGYAYEWTGLSHQEVLSGSQALRLYLLSALVVFLVLAALYESWSIPFAVLLTVPIGIFGAVAASTVMGQTNDIYFKVGLLTTIGLAAKNAILIVEFAVAFQKQGRSLIEATIEACQVRLRPIIMTSVAFILGVMPLAVSTGAGSGSQNSIGIGVVGGMLAATVLGIFFIPLMFYVVRRVFSGDKDISKNENEGAGKSISAPLGP